MIVLIPNCGFLSETSRMLGIAQALHARGGVIMLASHGGPYESILEESGLPYTRVAPAFDKAQTQAFLDSLLSMGVQRKPLYDLPFIREAVKAEADLFKRVGARMVVIGFNLVSLLSSRLAGIPLASSHAGAFVPPVLERRMCPVPVNPPKPILGALPASLQRWLANSVPWWLHDPVRHLNQVAHEMDLPRVPGMMGLMCADLTLVTEAPDVLGIDEAEMDAWRPLGHGLWPTTRMRYVGPLYARLKMPLPERVQRFVAAPGPVVYVSPTSVSEAFLRALVPAVAGAGARVLVGATVHDVRDLQCKQVMVEPVMPNHVLMPQVDAAVIMGGQGSVQTAMASGTPFVGMPYHGEQELNVSLAERFGMAIRLSPRAAGGPEMTAAVRRLLNDPGFRVGAARAKAKYAGMDGADRAAQVILHFLKDDQALAA